MVPAGDDPEDACADCRESCGAHGHWLYDVLPYVGHDRDRWRVTRNVELLRVVRKHQDEAEATSLGLAVDLCVGEATLDRGDPFVSFGEDEIPLVVCRRGP